MTDKSTSSPSTPALDPPHAGGHGDAHSGAHGDSSVHLAHHFDTPQQQYQSAKVGMWVFLGTELLMFGGLFCAYAVYRHSHPEVFEYAHRALDTNLGAINTAVLIASSFTMAWGVRAAQLGQKALLCVLLVLTLLGGVGFMSIKSIEYTTKWKHQLFPGELNRFSIGSKSDERPGAPGFVDIGHESAHEGTVHEGATHEGAAPWGAVHEGAAESKAGTPSAAANHAVEPPVANVPMNAAPDTAPAFASAPPEDGRYFDPNAYVKTGSDASKIKPTFADPAGLAPTNKPVEQLTYDDLSPLDRERVATFFSIYFIMTGLHGVHVLVGMGLITWVLIRATRGEFSGKYFTPVDLVGLYWHLVDLIWIFLFPLLYLIH